MDLKINKNVWTTADIAYPMAVRHFHSATLSVGSLASIEPVLTGVLDYSKVEQDGHTHLFQTKAKSDRAEFLEVHETLSMDKGLNSAGTVHHIAFRAEDDEHQLALRQRAIDIGLYPTEVINRYYFKSVYFKTRAGILFEIATDRPGFTADEQQAELGTHLALPPFLETDRALIESRLKSVIYDPTL